jgi:hypothetical protein
MSSNVHNTPEGGVAANIAKLFYGFSVCSSSFPRLVIDEVNAAMGGTSHGFIYVAAAD